MKVLWRRCSLRRASWWLGCLLLCFAPTAEAQNGGLFLLVPFGARAVGQGEAVVADSTLGTEGVWWNAAALARLPKKELAVHHSQTVFAMSDMVSFAVPSKVLGTLAASAYIVDYGETQNTDNVGNILGTITNRSYLLAASYATPVGKRLSAGLTYKFVMQRYACSGVCGDTPVLSGQSNALDLGAQYVLPIKQAVTIGASIRNIGPAIQVKDAAQADPLPRVIQVGVRGRIPLQALDSARATLDVSADIINAPALNGAAGGIGVALGYRNQLFLRGGYKVQPGQGGGPSIGFGLQRGGLGVDIGRRFDAVSSQLLGDPPTYVMLRARF